MPIRSYLVTTLLISVLIMPNLAVAGQSASKSLSASTPVEKYIHASTNLLGKGVKTGVNINTADAETLALELKGIGQKRAEAIIAYREQHGPFKSIDDLSNIKGIGKKI